MMSSPKLRLTKIRRGAERGSITLQTREGKEIKTLALNKTDWSKFDLRS